MYSNRPTRGRDVSSLPHGPHELLFDRACEYMERGWSVIPLHFKRPALQSWNEYRHRRPSYDEIRGWFNGTSNTLTGVGILTGLQSELVVIDCDTKADSRWWYDNYPRSPLVVYTGGGGSHHYYRTVDGVEVGNRTRIRGRKIDLRGEGGYVAAPPSLHTSGQVYQWKPADGYRLADIPYFDPQWVATPRPKTDLRAASFSPSSSQGHIHDIRAYVRSIPSVAHSGGHNGCFRVACLLRDAGLDQQSALRELQIWNQSGAAHPPWSIRELEHKIESAFQIREQS